MFTFFKKISKDQKGFTLVELLVSIGIFTIITSVAVFNNTQFNSSILLTNLAYEIALSVRQSQVYGVTVKKDSNDNFSSAYGIHFDLASPTTYILFQDTTPADHYYNSGDVSVETFNIQKGNGITQFCVTDSTTVCHKADGATLDISFVRPNPDALIYVGGVGTRYNKAEVCVVSPKNIKRKIVIENTGQISVSTDGSVCNL